MDSRFSFTTRSTRVITTRWRTHRLPKSSPLSVTFNAVSSPAQHSAPVWICNVVLEYNRTGDFTWQG